MSYIRSFFILCVIVCFVFAGCSPDTQSEILPGGIEECKTLSTEELPDLGGREIVIAIEGSYPPFNYLDTSSGEGIGWDYDTGREICQRLNCVPVFAEVAWDGIFIAMASGEYDVLFDGVSYTSERDESVDYSCAYANAGHVIVSRMGENRYSTPTEFFADKTLVIGTQIGSNSETVSLEFAESDRVKSFDDFPTAIQALLSGDVDAAITDSVAAVGYIKANPSDLKIIQPEISKGKPLGLVFPPDSDLIGPINQALAAMAADGTLDSLNKKWLEP